jgi:predicted ATPase
LNIQSSVLKYVDRNLYEEINRLSFFLSYSSYSLLSVERIRSGAQYPYIDHYREDIGMNGEELAQCIEAMDENTKRLLNDELSNITGQNIAVRTINLGNKVELFLDEMINDSVITTKSAHISDGLLRLIAFYVIYHNINPLALLENNLIDNYGNISKKYMILLDEIEDGINLFLTQNVICLLRSAEQIQRRQCIITTHSPVMLNDFNPEEIIFLWKDKRGAVHSRKFFDTEEMREALTFLNPGEIWENYGKDMILTKLNVTHEER